MWESIGIFAGGFVIGMLILLVCLVMLFGLPALAKMQHDDDPDSYGGTD